MVFDRDAWDALIEHDALLAKALDDGKATAKPLAEDAAHALRVYTERMNYARDWGNSNLMPSLPPL